jgi:hypothetical protein
VLDAINSGRSDILAASCLMIFREYQKTKKKDGSNQEPSFFIFTGQTDAAADAGRERKRPAGRKDGNSL